MFFYLQICPAYGSRTPRGVCELKFRLLELCDLLLLVAPLAGCVS